MKLYKAVDKLTEQMCAFLVYPNGEVATSYWAFSNSEEVAAAKDCADQYLRESAERFNDAIDPILIAEW